MRVVVEKEWAACVGWIRRVRPAVVVVVLVVGFRRRLLSTRFISSDGGGEGWEEKSASREGSKGRFRHAAGGAGAGHVSAEHTRNAPSVAEARTIITTRQEQAKRGSPSTDFGVRSTPLTAGNGSAAEYPVQSAQVPPRDGRCRQRVLPTRVGQSRRWVSNPRTSVCDWSQKCFTVISQLGAVMPKEPRWQAAPSSAS